MAATPKFTFHPLTPERWPDLEKLFGKRGACGGCWCMCWRLERAAWIKGKEAGNRRAFRKIVVNNEQPGVLAYDGEKPIGWCAVAPRKVYTYLERSQVLAPVDDQEVWSITCLFIARAHRRRGVSTQLLKAAIDLAHAKGAKIVEGYPVEPYSDDMPGAFAWTGLVSSFEKAGFKEVLRRSKGRPIMRRKVARVRKRG